MKSKNGVKYTQNYDVIVKWLAEALRGETLDVIGVKTGRITEVFGFEPVEIAVQAGRVDVLLRDDSGAVYHLEEQRNLRKADLHRSASYHFQAAKQWGPNLTDIILASGDVSISSTVIATKSGKYEPIIIDFTLRDGRKRLAEIREAIENGTFENWLELVFLPLCGKETGEARSAMVEEVLRFESKLYHNGKIPVRLLVATLILSNKLISKERLIDLWEEIKMLDIFDIAIEEGKKSGIKEGKTLGIKEGKMLGIKEGGMEAAREMVLETLIQRFNIVSTYISEQVRKIQNQDILKGLHRQAVICKDLHKFETVLKQVI